MLNPTLPLMAVPTGMKIFFLLLVPGLALCSPVTAHHGGNPATQVFYCNIPGCAADVEQVFCNDEPVKIDNPIANCTSAPAPNTVCQQGGRAFVCTDANGECEFEGRDYIPTKKCTDTSSICSFPSASPSPLAHTADRTTRGIIVGVSFALLLVLVLVLVLLGTRCKAGSCQFASSRNQQQARVMQREISKSDTHGAGPGLDDGAPSQCDCGA